MAEKKVIELEVNSNIGTLKQQFKEAQLEVQALSEKFGATSAQAVEAAKSAAILKDKIGDAKALTDAFNPDAKFKALSGSLTGVAGGFSVVTGALGAFGKQNEDVEKALLKVQSAMALASGAQAIGESIDSFKQLKAVVVSALTSMTAAKVLNTTANEAGLLVENQTILSKGKNIILSGIQATLTSVLTAAQYAYNLAMSLNPIGAMVIAVTALIAAGYALINMFNDSAEAEANQNASIKKNTKALETQIKANEKASTALKTKNGHEYKMAEASGASANALHKLAIRHANEEIALERASKATAHNTYIKEKNTLAYYRNVGASDEVIKKQEALTTAARENSIKEGKELAAAIENKAQLIRDNDVRLMSEKTKSREKESSSSNSHHEKTVKNEKVQGKEKIDITKNIEDEKIRLMDEGQAKEEAVILLAYKRKKEEQDKQLKDKSLKQKDYDTLQILNKEGQEADLLAIEQKYILQAEEARKTAQEKKDAEFFRQENLLAELTDTAQQKLYDKYKIEQEAAAGNDELLLALKNKYNKDKEALDKEAADKEIATAKDVAEKKRNLEEKKIQMTMDGLSILNDVIQMNAGKSEKAQRKAFKAQKAFNLASAIANTYLAVTGALTAGGNPIKLATGMQFVEAGIAAATGAVQIAKIAGTQFDSSSFSKDTSGDNGGGTAPNMSAPQFNVVGQSGVNQLASLNQQPIQAYVVSGQVTSQQALDRNRLANATLGG
jgi:hypothetical protein